jgi:nitrogen regulatory protein P-II 1
MAYRKGPINRHSGLFALASLEFGLRRWIAMKLLIAVIQPIKLQAVQQALASIAVTRMTVCDAQGFARQRGQREMYRGHEYKSHLLRKIALEVMVNDDFLERTIDTIVEAARTGPEGQIGDGKIFVLPASETIQLFGEVHGPEAV